MRPTGDFLKATGDNGHNDEVVHRLRTIAEESPDLKEAAQVYAALLPLLYNAGLHVPPPSLTAEEARAKMECGRHLLDGLDLELDLQEMRALMLRLASSLEDCLLDNRIRLIVSAIHDERLDIAGLLSLAARGESDAIRLKAEERGLDHKLLKTLADNTLRPAFRAWHGQLSSLGDGVSWSRGTCYVCGAPPTLGELRDNNLVKHLRCGRCGADWQFRRIQCFFCGTEDHRSLRFLYIEDDKKQWRVEVCDACRGYLKVITTFSATSAPLLQAEDLATLHLDYAAQGQGYSRPGVQGTGSR